MNQTYKFDDREYHVEAPCFLVDPTHAIYILEEEKSRILYLAEVVPVQGEDGVYVDTERGLFVNLGRIRDKDHIFPDLHEIAERLKKMSALEMLLQHYDADYECFTFEDLKQPKNKPDLAAVTPR